MKCPVHPIDIPQDREIVELDGKEFPWKRDPNGYFLIRLDRKKGLICCGHVSNEHRMNVEFRSKDPDRIIKEIASRKLCSLSGMGYVASELMIAGHALESGKEYVQR